MRRSALLEKEICDVKDYYQAHNIGARIVIEGARILLTERDALYAAPPQFSSTTPWHWMRVPF